MAPRSKGLTSHYALKMRPEEREIIERVQASLAAVGVTASLNDVLRHLVRAAEIPRPADVGEAQGAWLAHQSECDDCKGHRTPQCPDGVLIRREYQRHLGLRDGRSYALQPVGSARPNSACDTA
jgi:hypothetical protein